MANENEAGVIRVTGTARIEALCVNLIPDSHLTG
jgi:hypothetical protein